MTRKIHFLFISVLLPFLLYSTSFKTITIDGTNSGWATNETFTNCSNADAAYFTWDENYLYIGISDAEADFGNLATFVIIDSDPTGVNGSESAYAWQNYITVPFSADYVVVWKNQSGADYIEVRDYNDDNSIWDQTASANSTSLNTNEVNFAIGSDYREVRIKRSIIGSPDYINIAMFTHQDYGSNYRYFAWPSNDWTDGNSTADQAIPNRYGFILTNNIEPANSNYFNADFKVFDSDTDNNWATADNWTDNTLPDDQTLCIIPSSKAAVQISATEVASCFDLLINGTLTLKSTSSGTASLITNGTVSGNVNVERYVDEAAKDATWHYVSSPVVGQALDNAWMLNNSIAQSTPDDKYQLFRYDEQENYWIIYGSTGNPAAFGDIEFGKAKGYTVARNGAGVINFTGSVRTSDVTYPATYTSDKGKGWNLVGNPFTSPIGITNLAESTGKFLSDNSSVIDASYLALYVWDEQTGYQSERNDYKVISSGTISGYDKIDQNYVQSGQAFMVKVSSAGNLQFNEAMQYHADVAFYKSKEYWPSVELVVQGQGVANTTAIGFHDEMTAGLDPSFDVGKLKGNPDIALYSRLVEDNGVDFAIQALPIDELETYEIPVGLDISIAGVYEFSANQTNFDHYNIVLEDRKENTFTNLRWDTYFAQVNEGGLGRFYLHFKDATGVEESNLQKPIIKMINGELQISNVAEGKVDVRIVDIMGRVLDFRTFNTNSNVSMPLKLKTGIYILEISSNQSIFAHKFFIK